MKRLLPLLFVFILFSVAIVLAQEECPELVQTALESAEVQCADAGRNQICYGHTELSFEAQPDASNLTFENIGDIVDVASIQSLQLAGLDIDNGVWGVVLMRLQANIPNTLPGQNVIVMLFGNSEIRNAASSIAQQVPPEQEQTIAARQGVNVRELPTTGARILGSVVSGTVITMTGRTEDSNWVRVRFGERTGWIFAPLLAETDMETLIAVEPAAPQFGPMQAFYFSSGIGQTSCSEVPGDGMLIQTPTGVGSIDLTINEVQINMGSTVYFTTTEDHELAVYSLEGGARVISGGMTRTSVQGTRVRIPLNEGNIADGEPFEIESYDDDSVEFLPINVLEREIEIETPLDDEALERYLEYNEVFNNIDIEDVDETFDYIDEHWDDEDFDIVNYLIEELDYTDFNDDLKSYFEDELGYDFEGDSHDHGGDAINDNDNVSDDASNDSDNVNDNVSDDASNDNSNDNDNDDDSGRGGGSGMGGGG
ncbi:MAG: SH3 domain-containing protein [Anaerolineae bacterium]|nr:SH3 domain-containing protein [Anaerolineae bacterium]